ncbi:CUGBP Elav-like family member 2 [Babesia sp. Xinjiang]|uniref:CUGBP Elav-like family member 2 n=1 Tax=Babesia sp. Xinjiang TaxID=462227 RepID=UPI000A243D0E|nr:CUGBP Elav-like family member 2 [Babesia sp. Xinjiang]ORM40429.1 CUGBP Elav-like family member 2 [Babesia sp. Xinjiang]
MECLPPDRYDSVDVYSENSDPDPLNERRLRVWVGNIPPSVSTQGFLSFLKELKVPPVRDIILKRYPSRSRCFLFFHTREDAYYSINVLDGSRIFLDSAIPLEARLATPHDLMEEWESPLLSAQSDDYSVLGSETLLNPVYCSSFLSTMSDDYEILQDADDSTLWHMYKDKNDVPYYYNHITGCTQWERPIPPLLAVETAINERSRLGSPDGTNLFIFHIPPCWSDTDLAMHFTPFGNLVSAKIQKDANGFNAGFGFVSYDNPQSAAAAVRLMKGYSTNSKFLKVEYKKRNGGA